MPRRLVPFLAMGVVAGAEGGPGGDDPPLQVAVAGIPVQPIGRLLYADGTLLLHPKALVGGGADSNPAQSPDPAGDAYLRVMAGFSADWAATRRSRLAADLELERRAYADTPASDLSAWRAAAAWRWQGPSDTLRLGARSARTDEPLEETGQLADRDLAGVDLAYGYAAARWRLEATGGAEREDFREDLDGFAATRRDRTSASGQLRGVADWGRDASAWLRLAAGATAYRIEDPQQDSTVLRAAAGAETPLAGRLTGSLEGGVAAWRFADDFAGDPAYDDRREVRPEASARLAWRWGAEGVVHATGSLRTLGGFSSNLLLRSELLVYARTRVGDACMPYAAVSLWRNEATGAADGQDPDLYIRRRATLGLDWYPRREVVVRSEVSGIHGSYRAQDSYDRLLASVDLGVVF